MHDISTGEIISTFWHALYLDTSFACYFLAFSFLIFPFYILIPYKIFQIIHSSYVLILLILFSLITIAELEIYNEWGSKLSMKAVRYLQHPSEVIHSTSVSFLIFGFAAVALFNVDIPTASAHTVHAVGAADYLVVLPAITVKFFPATCLGADHILYPTQIGVFDA